jgi:methionine-rich copper-binding protein CopC
MNAKPWRRLTAWALAASATLVALPAQAHDYVVDQSPNRGELVVAGIIDIRLTFNNELLSLPGGTAAEIIVVGPLGEGERLQNNGCATVLGRDVSTRVDLDQPGDYRVSWRVVSSDGHPISQSFSFSVGNDSGHISQGIVPGTDCPGAITAEQYAQQTAAGEGAASETSAGIDFGYWLLWLAFPAAGLAIYLLVRPRRFGKTQ